MNKEQILNIVEKLAESGYKFQSEEVEVCSIRERTSNGQILLTFKNDLLDLCIVRIKYKLKYTQDEINFLNKTAHSHSLSLFYYYKEWVDFEYEPKDENELEEAFKFLLENYN